MGGGQIVTNQNELFFLPQVIMITNSHGGLVNEEGWDGIIRKMRGEFKMEK